MSTPPAARPVRDLLSLEKQVFNSPLFRVAQAKSQSQFTEATVKILEDDIQMLCREYLSNGHEKEVVALIRQVRPFLHFLSKAKAAKLVKSLLDMYLNFKADSDSDGEVIVLCRETIEWARNEKRSYLRRSLEERLVGLLYDTGKYHEALAIAEPLLQEVRTINDKNMQLLLLMWESKVYLELHNLDRSQNALSGARAIAHGMYLTPDRQAELDMQSGLFNAFEGQDLFTSYSYFYEAFEQYDCIGDKKAVDALKYMLLAKIMQNKHEDVMKIIKGKYSLKYIGPGIRAMQAISLARRSRSLSDFEAAVKKYASEFKNDKIFKRHLGLLYDDMFELNLKRIIQPYSTVQLDFIATKVSRSVEEVELTISKLILDKKINGIMEHQNKELFLRVFGDSRKPTLTMEALVVFDSLAKVVDVMVEKAINLY